MLHTRPSSTSKTRPFFRSSAIAAVTAIVGVSITAGVASAGPTYVSAAAAPSTYSIWSSSDRPTEPADPDTENVELGVKFKSDVDGWITAIRYYKTAQMTASREGTLWSSSGRVLARAEFPGADAAGWQTAELDTAVKISADTSYTASYDAPNGRYADDHYALSASEPVDNYDLTAVAGVFTYDEGVPTQNWRDSNYFADVVFTSNSPAGSTAPGTTTPAAPTTTTAPSTTSTPKPPTTTSTPAPSTTPKPTTTTTPPSNSAKPGPSNTGVPAGTVLTPYTGPHTITTAGTVIDSKDITGSLIIQAKNVTIRNSKIHDDLSATAGINVEDNGSATITDSEIYNFQVGIVYNNWTAIRVNMHDITFDGMKMASNAQLRQSWIHSPRPTADAHWDGVQVQSGVVNTVIQGNFIDATGASTNSALFLCPDLGPSTDGPLTVTGNWLDGGNYTVFILDGANGEYFISNISVTNNRFGHGGRYGPTDINVPVNWSANVWDDTGATVNR